MMCEEKIVKDVDEEVDNADNEHLEQKPVEKPEPQIFRGDIGISMGI